MKIATCTIARMENEYICEFVDYYKLMGVNKMYIYENNDIDGECLSDVLQPYIDEGFVELIDFREGHRFVQVVLDAYEDCYKNHGNEYDWILFIDPDEYLEIEDNITIIGWLKIFSKTKTS